jgi:hypothetical protein
MKATMQHSLIFPQFRHWVPVAVALLQGNLTGSGQKWVSAQDMPDPLAMMMYL